MAFKPEPKPSILEIIPYVAGKSTTNIKETIKLSSNESALGPSPEALKALQNYTDLHRYMDGSCDALRQAIAAVYDLNPNRLICGAGSDEIIHFLCQAFLMEGDAIVQSEYGFLMYEIYAKISAASVIKAKDKGYKVDCQAIIEAITPNTKLVFIANPNNPTGSYITKTECESLINQLPDHVLLVLDSAYAEYVGIDDYEAGIELVNRFDNVIMLRTFSKIYGLAGLRIGWGYASDEIIDILSRVRGPFNVSGAGQVAAKAAIEDSTFINEAMLVNDRNRKRLIESCQKLKISHYPSVANFLLIDLHSDSSAKTLYTQLRKQYGIIVRSVVAYNLPHCLRITIGNDQETDRLIAALTEIFNG